MSNLKNNVDDMGLMSDISLLIEQSKRHIASQANSTLTVLFWQIGKRINDDVLQNQRADYGKQVVPTLAAQLERLHGRSFSERNLRRMMQFATVFIDLKIVTPLATQLSWSHFIEHENSGKRNSETIGGIEI